HGNAGTDLGSVAVDGLLAAEDDADFLQVIQPADGRCQHIAGGQGVGAAKGAVGEQDRLVNPQAERPTKGSLGVGRPHGEGHRLEPVKVLDAQRLLQSMGIVGVDNERDAVPDQGVGHRVDPDLGGVGNLFDATDYEHVVSPRWYKSFSYKSSAFGLIT